MASTYSTNLAIELIGTGDQAGSWGNTTNTNLGTLIEQAISGYVTQAVSTGTDTTITIPNGATGVARNMYIELTGTGGTNTNLIVPANKKLYFIFNNSTGAVTVKVSGQTGVSVPQGKKVVLTSNGTDIVNGLNYIADFGSNSATITQLTATSATITNLTLTSLVISNLSIASANVTTLTSASATITNLINTSASITTITNSPTFSAGTANGVLYLNGSKVATSGSALTFSGTVFGVNGSAADGIARITGGASNFGGSLQFYADIGGGGNYYRAFINGINESGSGSALTFSTTTSGNADPGEKMRLDRSGNLGIGTASPLSRLNVAGTTAVTWSGPGDSSALVTIGTQGTAGGSLFVNTASLNSSFASGLAIDGTYSSFSSVVNIKALGVNSGGGYGSSLAFHTSSNTTLTERMRLDSSGNLGIGTSSPSQKLSVLVGDASQAASFQAATGRARVRPYADATSGAIIDATNAAENAYLPLTLQGSTLRLLGGGGSGAVVDSSGNLGLGVTPSAWAATYNAFQFGAAGRASALFTNGANDLWQISNAYFNGSNFIYYANGTATAYNQENGAHNWRTAASGTAGNTFTFTQAMTLDAGGRLLIGRNTSDPNNYRLQISQSSATYGSGIQLVYEGVGAAAIWENSSGALVLGNDGVDGDTERARITSGGDFCVGKTGTDPTVGLGMYVQPGGVLSLVRQGSTNGTQSLLLYSLDAAAYRFYVGMDGTVNATNTTITAISDQRLKENIRDIDAGLDKVMALKPRTFDWKAGKGKDIKNDRGWIAQEFEQVFPDMISEWKDPAPEGEEPYKAVRADLIPVLVKAMQEQQAMIEELKAKVAALESK